MKKFTEKWVKILKIVHLLFAFMWIGGGISIILLLLTISPQESHELYMRSLIIKLIDDWLIIPGALGIVIIGIIYGIWTNWGFFKYKWIIVKWTLTILMAFLGTFFLGTWVNSNVYPVEDISNYTLDNSTFFYNVLQTAIWASVQIFLLLIVIIISVFKPWKQQKK
ncbi:hypothetical protein EZS27_011730 [termite gut metagenome]|uniref:DUF2269 domain-containing protein n=1 Tax=termite gut metagenome TaxID=433724 RepID=A0A5J4S2P8_9ZZZZ